MSVSSLVGLDPTAGPVRVLSTIEALVAELGGWRSAGCTVGLVPTMGYLHDGHASLVARAAQECDAVVVAVFVNPLQFGAHEDLVTYPRDLDHDVAVAGEAGADLIFAPSVAEMYPEPVWTTISMERLATRLEGSSRPTHFAGVATVVAKLFNLVGPCRAYFGEKDYQQLLVVRRLVADLSFPVEVIGCPTAREPDGLALSSRNIHLGASERVAATVLHRALQAGVAMVEGGECDPAAVRRAMIEVVATEPGARLDYAEAVDASDLSVPEVLAGGVRLLIAAWVGGVRLIDNVGVIAGGPLQGPDGPLQATQQKGGR